MSYSNNSAVINYTRYLGSVRIDIAAIYVQSSIQLTNLKLMDLGNIKSKTFNHLYKYYQDQMNKINLILSLYKFELNNNDINITIDIFENYLYKHQNSTKINLPIDYYSNAYLCRHEDLKKLLLSDKVDKYVENISTLN